MRRLDRIKSTIIFICILFAAQLSWGQEREEVYGTNTGHLKIIAVNADTLLRAHTTNLVVILNYQTAEFELILDKGKLETENDSLNKLLALESGEKVSLNGRINLPYIKREKHPPKDIEISAYLSSDPTKTEIIGEGRLEYLFNGRYSSMLTMNFILDADNLGIPIDLPKLSDKIEVELSQAVLNKPYQ